MVCFAGRVNVLASDAEAHAENEDDEDGEQCAGDEDGEEDDGAPVEHRLPVECAERQHVERREKEVDGDASRPDEPKKVGAEERPDGEDGDEDDPRGR